MARFSALIALAALVVALVALFKPRNMVSAPASTQAPTVNTGHQEEEQHVEVAEYMGRLQRFHQKWWIAGRAGNAELAGFYLHEMEEAMETIADAEVIEDGTDVSNFMRIYGEPTIERMETILKEKGVKAMMAEGRVLVENCNACHVASGYPYVRIIEPTAVVFPDQDFSPIMSK